SQNINDVVFGLEYFFTSTTSPALVTVSSVYSNPNAVFNNAFSTCMSITSLFSFRTSESSEYLFLYSLNVEYATPRFLSISASMTPFLHQAAISKSLGSTCVSYLFFRSLISHLHLPPIKKDTR